MSIRESTDWFYQRMIKNLENCGDLKGVNELEQYWARIRGMRINLQKENETLLALKINCKEK